MRERERGERERHCVVCASSDASVILIMFKGCISDCSVQYVQLCPSEKVAMNQCEHFELRIMFLPRRLKSIPSGTVS